MIYLQNIQWNNKCNIIIYSTTALDSSESNNLPRSRRRDMFLFEKLFFTAAAEL